MKRRNFQKIAVGIGFCPFWWQFGVVANYPTMIAIGPFRMSWKGW